MKFTNSVRESIKRRGFYYTVRVGLLSLTFPFWAFCYKTLGFSRSFKFQGDNYHYFYHNYNKTWNNERAVEVPIIWEVVKEHHGRRILEIGNVLSHYFPVSHDIVDKYEHAFGVINQDVAEFHSSERYDLIVSISTLEHVGMDEHPRDPTKTITAFENLKGCLAPGGKLVVTLPLGYNFEVDKLLREGKIQFSKQFCLERVSIDNKWIEVDPNDHRTANYRDAFAGAKRVVIGTIER